MMRDALNLLGKKNVVIFGDSSKLKLFVILLFVITIAVVCVRLLATIECVYLSESIK
jgi:hypothetical protein